MGGRFGLCRHYLFFRAASSQVFSAQMSLTTVFGMGTGGPSSQSTPTHETVHLVNARDILTEQNTNCKCFFHFFYIIFNFVNFQQKDAICTYSQGKNKQEIVKNPSTASGPPPFNKGGRITLYYSFTLRHDVLREKKLFNLIHI